MKNLIIIPSRLESARLPNKPLADINGEPMIAHVYKRAKEANIANVIVAAGNVEIKEAIETIGGEAILTNPDHASGSDRIYEALNKYDKEANLYIFHSGTIENNEKKLISNGGRVLNFVCLSSEFKTSRDKITNLIKSINWPNGFYRKDIGYKVID